MPLSIGDKLGPYEILAPIGKGGMGEVYKARDTRLDRIVALKISSAHFSERFEREAKAIAALNHPKICTLFDVGPNYLVMEFIDGTPLKGPLPLDEELKYAVQICDALDAAHKKGITHRDLKPANILVTKAGIKLLDFGLAKLASANSGLSSKPDDATLTMALTGKNEIVGTPYYMSPEQLQAQATGQEIDGRSDIFSFGIMLYEMLTGKRAFEGASPASVIAAIVERPAPSIADVAPPALDRALRKCLAKDPDERWQSARDLKDELEWVRGGVGHPISSPAVEPDRRQDRLSHWFGWGVAAVLALAAIPLAYMAYRHNTEETPRALRFTVPPPERGNFSANGFPQLSPDGRHIAFIARPDGGRNQLWVRDLDSLTSRSVVREGVRYPFWSPDSRSIGFWSGGKLQKVDVTGGPALTLRDATDFFGGTWNRDDVILFSTGAGPIQRVSAAGGVATPVTTIDPASGETSHGYPWFLPDGRHFLYTAGSGDEEKTAIYVGDLVSKEMRTRVMLARSNAVYVPPGYILFHRDRTLMAQAFDAGNFRTNGDPFPVAEQVDTGTGAVRGYFSASLNGVLAFTSGALIQNVEMTWFDRSGKAVGMVGAPADIEWPAISPDGKTVAFDRADAQTGYYDIWLHDLARGADSRFTFNSKNNRFAVWSPDGNTLAFNSDRSGSQNVYKKATGGTGQDEIVDKDELHKRPTDWSPDGRFLIEETATGSSKTQNDIWVVPTTPGAGGEPPRLYLQTEFAEGSAKVSPNGKWLAYRSNESRRNEVYIMTFPNPGGKWQISTSGGNTPVWGRDGRQLFYVNGDKIMAVDIKGTGANPEPGVPQPLFDVRLGGANPSFDVSKDGLFLIPTVVEQASAAPITVVVNWMAGLKK